MILMPLRSSVITMIVIFLLAIILLLATSLISSSKIIKPRKCRLVAVADLHGDLAQTKRVLRMAKIIDDSEEDKWIAGCTTLVQMGDRVDRGPDSILIMNFLNKLSREAPKRGPGGKVIQLIGNHEALNMASNINYAHPQEVESKGGEAAWQNMFSRRGIYGQQLRKMPLVYIDDESKTVFVHGGLTPKWARHGADAINMIASQQMQGDKLEGGVFGNDGPVWDRSVLMEASGIDPFGNQNQNQNQNKKSGGGAAAANAGGADDDGDTTHYDDEDKKNDKKSKNKNLLVEDQDADENNNNDAAMINSLKKKKINSSKTKQRCPLLYKSLKLMGNMTRMIVGHTPQMSGKIGFFCNKKLIAADVGISGSMMNKIAAVEILGDAENGDVVALY